MNNFDNKDILNAVEKGIHKGKRARRARKALNINLIALALVMVAFTVSVNVSTTLASSLKDVPILGKIVGFIRIGSGYEDAAEQGYFADGDVIAKDDGYTVSIEGYYYSDTNLNAVIRLDGKFDDDTFYNLKNVKILDTELNEISGGFLGYGGFGEMNGSLISNITLTQKERTLPDELILRFDISSGSRTAEPVEIGSKDTPPSFPETSIFMNLEAKLKKQVDVENTEVEIDRLINYSGMDIHIKSLKITPVTIDLELDVQSESMVFYDFKDIYFISDDMTYSQISNGTSRSGSMDTGYTYYFNTNYFFRDEPLTLVIDGIDALPSDSSTIIIDVEKNEMIQKIDDKLAFTGISDSGDEYFFINFTSVYDGQIGFSTYNGERFKEMGMSGMGTEREYYLKAEKKHIVGSKIEIGFWEYPNEIQFHEEININ